MKCSEYKEILWRLNNRIEVLIKDMENIPIDRTIRLCGPDGKTITVTINERERE